MSKINLQFRFILLLAVLLIAIVPLNMVLANSPEPVREDRPVTVMTRNLYLGADLTPIFQAIGTGDPTLIGQATFQVYQNALNSNIPGRASVIAHEIASNQPELVGLQEVVAWSGPLGSADFLPLLLEALKDEGASYEAIAVAPGFGYELPVAPGATIGLEVRDVLLARTDLRTSRSKLSNIQTGQYEARVTFPLPDGTRIEIPRQWASVDVKIRGKSFRFITTHLESIGPPMFPINVRYLQAQELLAGPAATELPVVLLGDINTEPGVAGDAAQLFIEAGFVDSWQAAYPDQPGYTCCHPADLSDRNSTLEEQIDLILTRGDFSVAAIDILGDAPEDFDQIGKWPSDHAGVVATLLVPKHPD
jgi:endonuclease/exonuclease/phosphatase family metal-dependent hydrolase